MDETKTTATVRSGSGGADSGQSSSADTSSSRGSSTSRSDSIADSLEDQARAASVEPRDLSNDAKEHEKTALMGNSNNFSNPATPAPQDTSGEQAAMKQPLRSALVNNNNNNIIANDLIKQTKSNNNNYADIETQQQKNANNTSSGGGGNNFSGLNLNMSASEMRELLARRKKFDPKKAQMNIRQKYEIIQQM